MFDIARFARAVGFETNDVAFNDIVIAVLAENNPGEAVAGDDIAFIGS